MKCLCEVTIWEVIDQVPECLSRDAARHLKSAVSLRGGELPLPDCIDIPKSRPYLRQVLVFHAF